MSKREKREREEFKEGEDSDLETRIGYWTAFTNECFSRFLSGCSLACRIQTLVGESKERGMQ